MSARSLTRMRSEELGTEKPRRHTMVHWTLNQARLNRLLGRDTPADLAAVLAVFIAYLILDRLTQAMVAIERVDLAKFSLLASAASARWWLYLAVLVAVIGAYLVAGTRLLAPWSALEHGSTLRLLAAPLIVYLAWKGALFPFNFIADETHLLDRLLVAALGAGALARPMFLIPLALQYRVISEQTLFPFSTAAAKNVDEFLVVSLLVVAAGHVVYVLTSRAKTAAVILALTTVVATHFYIPGKGKVAIGWVTQNDMANLPLAGHTAGWLGQSDGGLARSLSGLFDTLSPAVIVGTLVLELGAVVAVAHPRLLRWWIPGWLGFHIMTFVTIGFFFMSWALLEMGLLTILVLPRFRSWVAENATPGRGIVAVLAVLGGSVLYHPPGLAWFDAPISYGYEVEAVGVSGQPFHVPLSAFAPLDHEMTFTRLQLTPTVSLSGGYGSLGTSAELDRLAGLTSFEAIDRLESEQPTATLTAESQAFVLAFFDHTNSDLRASWLYGLGPPSSFWSGREGPRYDFDEPLAELHVFLVTANHHADDGTPSTRRQPVLAIARDAEGRGIVVEG